VSENHLTESLQAAMRRFRTFGTVPHIIIFVHLANENHENSFRESQSARVRESAHNRSYLNERDNESLNQPIVNQPRG
jgi:hypothetical protein